MDIIIRPLRSNDIATIAQLFTDTIHHVNIQDYTKEEITAWAPLKIDYDHWQKKFENKHAFVAELNNQIVGFIDMTPSGYLNHLYIHKDFQRKGIARKLVEKIINIASEKHLESILTESSITAKPFFEAMGFKVQQKQEKLVRGRTLINYIMLKKLV